MRVLLAAIAMLLFATAAWADADFSVRLEIGNGNYTDCYGDGPVYYWNGYNYTSYPYAYQPTFQLGITSDDWAGYYTTTPATDYYRPRTSRRNPGYQSIIKPMESIIEPMQPLVPSHPADRPGFKIYQPRSQYAPPELYGDYIVDEDGYPVGIRSRPNYVTGPRYNHRGYQRPTVYHYSYGYAPYYTRPVYTAPACPEYGYTGAVVYQQVPAYDPSLRDYQSNAVHADEINVYEGDVYHIQYDQPVAPVAPKPQVQPSQTPAPQQALPSEPGQYAFGKRFYDQVLLETPAGVVRFYLDGEGLYCAPETGPGQEVSPLADAQLGGFAAYMPGEGLVVLFRQGDRIAAAYEAGGGWWVETLPHHIDFSQDVTLGLVGGLPWAVFNAQDGSRYVVSFTGGAWQEIGSGSSG
ncbi:hypothetical protein JW859_02225 [bacterium]|nr:hypothetical protein [bacterium]